MAACVGDEGCDIVVVEDNSMDEVEKHAEVGVARDSGEPSCMLSETAATCVLDGKLVWMVGGRAVNPLDKGLVVFGE